MTSRYSAVITVSAGERARAVYESLEADERFYPENPVSVGMELDGDVITIRAGSDNLAHLRAGLNSTLRLVHAGYGSLESAR